MYRVTPAFDKEEFGEILDDITNKLEDNWLFSVRKSSIEGSLIDKRTISDKLMSTFKDNDFPIYSGMMVKMYYGWLIKTPKVNYQLKPNGKVYDVYVKGDMPRLDIKDIKGLIVAEIIKRDLCLVFESRKGLSITLDNIDEWDEKMGERKATHKKEKRARKYKERLDTYWKKAKRKQRKEKIKGIFGK